MRERVFHQLVVSAEVLPPVVEMMHHGVVLVGRTVQALNAILPRANPQAVAAVHQHGVHRVAPVGGRIAGNLSGRTVETCQSMIPHAYVEMAMPVFSKRHHAAGHAVVGKGVITFIIFRGSGGRPQPYYSVTCHKQGVNNPALFALQLIGVKLARATVETHHSAVGTHPDVPVVIFSQRAHIVVRQNAGRIGIVTVVTEMITIISQQPLLSAYPHHPPAVEQQAASSLSPHQWGLRDFSQRESLSHGGQAASQQPTHKQELSHFLG